MILIILILLIIFTVSSLDQLLYIENTLHWYWNSLCSEMKQFNNKNVESIVWEKNKLK